jgi:hypothetical protein
MLSTKSFTLAAIVLVFTPSCHQGSRADREETRAQDQRIRKPQTPIDSSFQIRVYSVATRGFGYAVYQEGGKVIDQPYIPAVQHIEPFRSREEAERTAQLVNSKLQAHQFPPSVTIHELDSLRINY